MISKKFILNKICQETNNNSINEGALENIKKIYYNRKSKKIGGSSDSCDKLIDKNKIFKCKDMFIKKEINEMKIDLDNEIANLNRNFMLIFDKYLSAKHKRETEKEENLYDELATIKGEMMYLQAARNNLQGFYEYKIKKLKEGLKV